MKTFLVVALLILSTNAWSASLTQSPASSADNTVSSSDPSVVGITANTDYDAFDGNATDGFGAYLSSQNSIGLYSTSYGDASAFFTSGTSANSQPTVVIQGVGGNADLLQVQDAGSSVLMSIDKDGQLKASSGLLLPASGSCDAAHRGALKVVQGGGGVADVLQACLKAAGGSYSWVNK